MRILNWKRRLLLAWTAFSACWVLGWGWYYDLPSCAELHPGEIEGTGWHCHGPLSSEGSYETVPLLIITAVIVGVPMAVFFAGVAVRFLLSQNR